METATVKTAKRTIKETTEREVEIKIPSFLHAAPHYYKIISEKEAVQVYSPDYSEGGSVYLVGIDTVFCTDEPKEISEEKFNEERSKILNKLANL